MNRVAFIAKNNVFHFSAKSLEFSSHLAFGWYSIVFAKKSNVFPHWFTK